MDNFTASGQLFTRVIQFVYTHRRSYKTTSFDKEKSIAIAFIIRNYKFRYLEV